MHVTSQALFSAAQTSTAYSLVFQPNGKDLSFQAYGTTSSGAGAAAIKIWGSNLAAPAASTDVDWKLLGTISLTLATTQSNDAFAASAVWKHIKAEVDSISGTGASVQAYMAVAT